MQEKNQWLTNLYCVNDYITKNNKKNINHIFQVFKLFINQPSIFKIVNFNNNKDFSL